ncbi:hypothetical protein MGLY_17010 [Neomoorella glycerini]|uniref:Uncharacterized protein n=1 Tax=Neomoorella glycerini TaxID=55779 RepID=A0A6I5ZRZ1_9FIRM|nr:hypothetical protein MGLY_17010 [Moorella glycerini]
MQEIKAAGNQVAVTVDPAQGGITFGTGLPAPHGIFAVKDAGIIFNAGQINLTQVYFVFILGLLSYSNSLRREGSASHS